jgi:CDP-6-deoxy-D-xylo-4-hexulose-3-dehydrase
MNRFAGRFFFIAWPHTDQGRSSADGFAVKNRPALAISEPDDQGDVVLLKVTGSSRYAHAVPFAQEDLDSGVLRKPSFIRTDRFLTVHSSELNDWGAVLTDSKLKECHRAISVSQARAFSRLAHTSNRPGDDPLRLAAEAAEALRAVEAASSELKQGHGVEDESSKLKQQGTPSTSSPQLQPGTRSVPYAGRVFTEDEVEAAVSSTLDFWLTLGPEGEAFEKELAQLLGVKHSLLVNSGSSANLVSLSALTTHKLPDHKRLRPGDEVITAAAGFPTTVAPILQNGMVAVFIDNDPETGNAWVESLEAAYQPGKTKAVMMAHALGNPFDVGAVLEFCHKHDLWLIEDNCDALGCTYSMPVEKAKALGLDHLLKIAEKGGHGMIRLEDGGRTLTAPTGTWGDISTQSFYPPHHLTMGEGGAVNIIRRPPLKTYAESFRDWGRDCWCPSGKDNTCGKRFGWNLGELPDGYDHKYIYSHLGYNLKPLDPQAAIGRQQLKRLPAFIEARKHNWETLRRGLADLEEFFDFSLPTHATSWQRPHGQTAATDRPLSSFSWDTSGCRTECSWFGFMLRVRPGSPFTHSQLGRYLDEKRIGNRMLFGGNLLRQPVFVQLRKDNPGAIRVLGRDGKAVGEVGSQAIARAVPGADAIMNTALFLGTYPGLSPGQLEYEIETIRNFAASH